MSNCETNKVYFTQSNKNNNVVIGTYFNRNFRVTETVNGVSNPRDYSSITLSGCIDAKDADNNDLDISLTEQVDDTTTGIYKVDANNWQLIVSIATTLTIAPGSYNFAVYGVPADGKKYLETSGVIEFKLVADC